MVTIMDKMIRWSILCGKYLTIFVFYLSISMPFSIQAKILPDVQTSFDFKNSSFLEIEILNIKSFNFLSFIRENTNKSINSISSFSLLANSPNDVSTKRKRQDATGNWVEVENENIDNFFHAFWIMSIICALFIIYYYGLKPNKANK